MNSSDFTTKLFEYGVEEMKKGVLQALSPMEYLADVRSTQEKVLEKVYRCHAPIMTKDQETRSVIL